jgi:hypothetical protein
VTVVSALLLAPPAGKVWDPGFPGGFTAPDVYVKLACGTKSGESDREDDTFAPMFKDEVLTATAQQLGAGVTIQVYDYDSFGADQLIGACSVPFTKTDLTQGSLTVSDCGGPDVQSILFSFAAQ